MQTAALFFSEDGAIDYTPSSAVIAGQVVVLGGVPMVAKDAIAANALGALQTIGIYKVPKITGAIAAGAVVFWNATGSPVTGDASSGAATVTAPGNTAMGIAVLAAASGDIYVNVQLAQSGVDRNLPAAKFTTDATGTQTADAGDLAGAKYVVWQNTAAGAVALTTRTATQMYADIPGAYVGFSFMLLVVSQGSGTVTVTAGAGVTITGTATVATKTTRLFVATFTSATALTLQSVSVGTIE